MTFEGSCNRSLFERWLEEMLVPQLKPNQTIILDNASFHKLDKIRDLVESAAYKLLYLPPDSPDVNEIEHYLFPIKNWLQKIKKSIDKLR